jgi:hypothetical protein
VPQRNRRCRYRSNRNFGGPLGRADRTRRGSRHVMARVWGWSGCCHDSAYSRPVSRRGLHGNPAEKANPVGRVLGRCHDALAYLRTNSSSPNVIVRCTPLSSRPKNVHCRGLVCGPLISLTV